MKIFQRQTQPPIGKPQPARKPKPDGENRSGLMALFAVLLVVSALSGLRFDRPMKVFVAGEIATQDVTADQDLLVEDVESTHSKREQVAQAQPPVFDLSAVAAEHLERELAELFSLMNATDEKSADELTMQLEDRLNAEVRSFTLSIWRSEEFQNIVLGPVLPWLKDYLAKGVSAEKRALLTYKNGIVLRDLASGREQLVTGLTEVKDKTDLFADLEVLLQRDLKAPLRIRKALESLLAPILSPSLTLNQETTQARKREVMAAVEPVYYQIKKGEIIVRQGGRVGPDQQIKMQALYTQRPSYFDLATSSGVLIIGTLLVLGMYLAYWHTFSRVNSDRDGSMLALVLLLFTLGAKILAVLRGPLADALVFVHIPPELFAFLMPVAGAMGVLALFFSYIVCFFACLLLAFACTAMVGGGLDLFTYYFLGGLFYTFFIKRSQSRSEMLATIFPLLGANLLTFAGVGLIHYHSLAVPGRRPGRRGPERRPLAPDRLRLLAHRRDALRLYLALPPHGAHEPGAAAPAGAHGQRPGHLPPRPGRLQHGRGRGPGHWRQRAPGQGRRPLPRHRQAQEPQLLHREPVRRGQQARQAHPLHVRAHPHLPRQERLGAGPRAQARTRAQRPHPARTTAPPSSASSTTRPRNRPRPRAMARSARRTTATPGPSPRPRKPASSCWPTSSRPPAGPSSTPPPAASRATSRSTSGPSSTKASSTNPS